MSEDKEGKKGVGATEEQGVSEEDMNAAAEGKGPESSDETGRGQADRQPGMDTPLPKIDFMTFIMSLNSSALFQLGLLEDPVAGKKEKNIPLAKQTIDVLGMLEEKTKGNLTHDEEQLLKNFLYELRMLYVKEMQ